MRQPLGPLVLFLPVLALVAGCNGAPGDGPGSTFTTEHFSGAGKCSGCHDGIEDGAGRDVSLALDWSTTMMANSARDPFWRAKVASELRRSPELRAEIDDKCSRCHAPMANAEAGFRGSPVAIFGDGFLAPSNPLHDAAMDGVSCTLCHQIRDDASLGTPDGTSGKFRIGTASSAVDRPLYGPFQSPRTAPMRNNVDFTPTYSPHIASSELCGTCHDVRTPIAGGPAGAEFPEQMVYSEWLASGYSGPAGKSCAGCHLPKTDGVVLSTWPMHLPTRNGFGRHTLVGGNTMMLSILAQNRDELGVIAGDFGTTLARTRESLSSAARLTLTEGASTPGFAEVRVQVENLSGHKLPSGYPSRRVWLHVVAKGSSGEVVFESGRPRADGGIEGVDADEIPGAFEPHHDVVDDPAEVQVYEAVLADVGGTPTHTLLRAAAYAKDNRLLPAGLFKGSAPKDVAVVGTAVADTDFDAGGDAVVYRIARTGPVTVEVTLRYQSMGRAHLVDLFGDDAELPVAAFRRMDQGATVRSEPIARASLALP